MNERKVGYRWGNRRRSRWGSISPAMAAAVLVVAVGVIGAVNYVVIDAFGAGHTTTTTRTSCSPSTAPQCEGNTSAGDASFARGLAGAPTS